MTTIQMDDGSTHEVTESAEEVVASIAGSSQGGNPRSLARGERGARFATFTKEEDDLPIYISVDHIASVMEVS